MSDKKIEVVDSKDYTKVLEKLKKDILQAQLKAALSITKELISLYWGIGKILSEQINKESWVRRLLKDYLKI